MVSGNSSLRPWFFLFTLFMLGNYGCQREDRVKVAVAANLYAPLEEVADAFAQEQGWRPLLSAASSGVLTAQIINQAPFSLFISANEKYPQRLKQEGLGVGEVAVLVKGQLVCWTQAPISPDGIDSLLKNEAVRRVVIPQPDLAPYGQVAKEWLMDQGVWEDLQDKLVMAENVGHTNSILHSGAVEAGFTANSVMSARELQGKGNWVIVPDTRSIDQTLLVLKNDPKTQAFTDFLKGPEAQEILAKYGYLAP